MITLLYTALEKCIKYKIYVGLDICGNSLMIFLGTVVLYKIVFVTTVLQKNIGLRDKVPSIPLLLSISLAVSVIAIVVCGVLNLEWAFYCIAVL
jgi:hypothetical protein